MQSGPFSSSIGHDIWNLILSGLSNVEFQHLPVVSKAFSKMASTSALALSRLRNSESKLTFFQVSKLLNLITNCNKNQNSPYNNEVISYIISLLVSKHQYISKMISIQNLKIDNLYYPSQDNSIKQLKLENYIKSSGCRSIDDYIETANSISLCINQYAPKNTKGLFLMMLIMDEIQKILKLNAKRSEIEHTLMYLTTESIQQLKNTITQFYENLQIFHDSNQIGETGHSFDMFLACIEYLDTDIAQRNACKNETLSLLENIKTENKLEKPSEEQRADTEAHISSRLRVKDRINYAETESRKRLKRSLSNEAERSNHFENENIRAKRIKKDL